MGDLSLHLARFDLGSNVSLVIESALGKGEPVAPPFLAIPNLTYAELERDETKVSSGGIVPMRWSETDVLFEQFQLREDTSYFIDVTLPISLAEARLLAGSHAAWPFDERLANVFERDPPRRWKEETHEDQKVSTTVTGQLLLRSHAGIIRFSTPFGSGLTAEVACRKFKYFEEFRTLLDDVAKKMAELLLAYDSPVSLSFGYGVEEASNDAALYFQMRHVMSDSMLPLAVDEIIQRPHVRLIEQNEVCLIEDLVEADPEVILDEIDFSTSIRGGPLSRFFGGFTPRELPQRVTFETVDTPENQYAKAFLGNCKRISRALQIRMLARKRRAAIRETEIWGSKLDEILQKDLWRQVGSLRQIPSNSQVLLRKRGYKELVKCDLSLRMSLALPWQHGAEFADGLIGDVRPVNQIYEYWCFLSLFEILDDFCKKIDGGNFIFVSKDGLRVQLARGQSSESRFEFLSADGAMLKVSLFYNRSFRRPGIPSADWKGSYTTTFNPDFSIAVSAPGVESPHWLHFDAKYRLERREVEELFDATEEVVGGSDAATEYTAELSRVYKQDDLFKMHTYRDGILSTRGAYILFPGDGVGGQTEPPGRNFFVRHPTALAGGGSQRIPSVGAFSLAPAGSAAQRLKIRELLSTTFEAVASGKNYKEEQGYFTV